MKAILLSNLAQGTIHYYPDFLTDKQQAHYYQRLQQTLSWQQDEIKLFGRQVKIPRLQSWHGDESAAYRYSGLDMIPKPWTCELIELKNMVEMVSNSHYNSVLANYYRDGNDKMGYHSDDEKELGERPVIASLSLGCARRFAFRHKTSEEKLVLDLPAGSLLIMAGDTQRYYKHGVLQQKKVLDGRINLTFRYIYRQKAVTS